MARAVVPRLGTILTALSMRPLTSSQVAQRTGLPVSGAATLLAKYRRRGWVVKTSRRWRLPIDAVCVPIAGAW